MLRSVGRSLISYKQNHDASSDKTQPNRKRRLNQNDLQIRLRRDHSENLIGFDNPNRRQNVSNKIVPNASKSRNQDDSLFFEGNNLGKQDENVGNWTMIDVGPTNAPLITISSIDNPGVVDSAVGPPSSRIENDGSTPHTAIIVENHNFHPSFPIPNPIDEEEEDCALLEHNEIPSNEDKEPHLGLQLIDFLWEFIREGSLNRNISSNLLPEAVSILKDIISLNFKSERVDFIQKCIVSISNNQAVNESIEVYSTNFFF